MPRIDFDAERREQRATSEPLELVIAGHVLRLNQGGIHPDVMIETERLNELYSQHAGIEATPEHLHEAAQKALEIRAQIDRVMMLLLDPGQEDEWAAVRAATGENQVTDYSDLILRLMGAVSGRPLESSDSPPSSTETPSSTTASTDASDSPAGAAFPNKEMSGALST